MNKPTYTGGCFNGLCKHKDKDECVVALESYCHDLETDLETADRDREHGRKVARCYRLAMFSSPMDGGAATLQEAERELLAWIKGEK